MSLPYWFPIDFSVKSKLIHRPCNDLPPASVPRLNFHYILPSLIYLTLSSTEQFAVPLMHHEFYYLHAFAQSCSSA